MKKFLLICTLAILASACAFAQESAVSTGDKSSVTVSSRGNDVRTVVHDLFAQLGRNYVLDANVRMQPLYLSLKGVEFEEALLQVCRLAELKFDVQNDIFYISRLPKMVQSVAKKADPKADFPGETAKKPEPKVEEPKGTYSNQVLNKKVTTRFDKIDLRDLMAELGRQTGLAIAVDTKVPKYRVDAYLLGTSLKYALDQITSAANLRYRMSNKMSIEIIPNVTAAVEDSKGTATNPGNK